jgi:hypothetical protein
VVKTLALLTVWLAVALPIALGPATLTVTRWLGGDAVHRCLCGMKRGTCGCPECARIERQRSDAARGHAQPTFRAACDDDDGFVRAPSLPTVVLSGERLVITKPEIAPFDAVPPPLHESQLVTTPTTPPPRT